MTVLRFVHSDPFRERERETVRVLDATTDERYGKRPEERTVEDLLRFGFIAVDKHAGPTSQDVVSSVRRVLGVEQAGHGGTLDALKVGEIPL